MYYLISLPLLSLNSKKRPASLSQTLGSRALSASRQTLSSWGYPRGTELGVRVPGIRSYTLARRVVFTTEIGIYVRQAYISQKWTHWELVTNLAGLPPRGTHPSSNHGRSPKSSSVEDVRSRLLAPTKSSLAKAARAPALEEPAASSVADKSESWRAREPQLSSLPASRSVSPQKKSTPSLPLSLAVENSPAAVALRTRARTKEKEKDAASTLTFKPEAKISLATVASPEITFATAASPRGLKFGSSSSFVIDPPLQHVATPTMQQTGRSAQSPLPDSSPLSEPDDSRSIHSPVQRPVLPGMERGYALSPMGAVRHEYLEETEGEHSLFSRINLMVGKRELAKPDILDRGLSNRTTFPQYSLAAGFSLRLNLLITQFQSLLKRAALLIPERKGPPERYYQVDPHLTLMTVLRGAESLDEMTIAWHALRSHLQLGQRYLEKYDSEYKASFSTEVLSSPVSTAPEVYDGLLGVSQGSKNNLAKLSLLYEEVPHFRQTMLSSWQKNPMYLPAWISAPENLRAAFPERSPEDRPVTVYYTADSERREIEIPENSSWKAAADFEPPPPSDKVERKRPKKVSIVEQEKSRDRGVEWERDMSIVYPRVPTATESSDGDKEEPEASGGGSRYVSAQSKSVYGSNTPFKSATEFFPTVPKSRSGSASTHQAPASHLPNPLHGMAAPTAYRYGQRTVDYRYSGWSGDELGPDLPPHQERNEDRSTQDRRGESSNMRQGAPDPGGDPSEPSDDEGDRRPGNRPRRSNDRVNNLEGGNGPYNLNPPYGTAVPTIDPKLEIGSLPEWDGNPETAIDYFWEVGQMAALEGWMPEALGFWLPSRLKKGSSVQMWFSTLASTKQSEMRRHYLSYLQTIKEKFLGRKCQDLMNLKFERMAFRQDGHEKESPQIFLNRMIRAIRMLANSDNRGPKEVFLIMRKAPIRWSTILVIENIHNSEELYDKVNEHDEALIKASRTDSLSAITAHNLAASLRGLGVSMDHSKSYNPTRRANLASTEATEQVEEEIEVTELSSSEDSDEPAIRSVHNTFKKRQRPPPKGGYKYPKNDHVVMKMGKKPPSPCKVCGSDNHWDKECPDYSVYMEKVSRGVFAVQVDPAVEELEMLYHSAFGFTRAASSRESRENLRELDGKSKTASGGLTIDMGPETRELDKFVSDNLESAGTPLSEKSTSSAHGPKKTSLKVHMEEIEDEYWANEARMPKAKKYTLESAEDWIDEDELEKEPEEEAIPADTEVLELPPPPS
ncbi:hypothetical protein B0H17DRAFT_1124058 [Mycena rosella]|uniref:Uncharacterized protein n=1 Tax=Mycena rosella TaxID=1033263 RepID=A0AAD7H0Z3_MYCRO|nr:hypothetical protein B0H17DRAFT_1124058 [Mycena rosella]